MLLANQIAGVLNQPFLQNKLMKHSNFLHVNTSSQKLKVGQKNFCWLWPISSLDSKIDCLSRMSRCSELTFCMLAQVHTN